MAEITALIKELQEQNRLAREQNESLIRALNARTVQAPSVQAASIPSFAPFDPTAELWADYYSRFETFMEANSVPQDKQVKVFLTNQTSLVYKQLANMAIQQSESKDIKDLTLSEIVTFMKAQYDPKRFVVRERYKFWSDMQRKPGETIQELAARIRQDAATCNFPSIKNPQDEALRTRFMCSINNEAVLKALFKMEDDLLSFDKAISIAQETEDAAKVAKETVYGTTSKEVNKVNSSATARENNRKQKGGKSASGNNKGSVCYRCGATDHRADSCHISKNATCNYCKKPGHYEKVCRQKQREGKGNGKIKSLKKRIRTVTLSKSVPELMLPIALNEKVFTFEADTGAGENFCSESVWKKLGRPKLQPNSDIFQVATNETLPVIGSFQASATFPEQEGSKCKHVNIHVTKVPGLNLLGRDGIRQLGVDVNALLSLGDSSATCGRVNAVFDHLKPNKALQDACKKACDEYPELFKAELGCLKDFELEVKFKEDARPVFCKPRPVPFAIQEDLNAAIDAGIARGIWKPTQFNDYGTPVVPIRKALLPGQTKAKIRVCGDYSVTVNPQLETHRQLIPLPEDLMRKLGGGYGFTKIDLADAYNQIKLSPDSQRKLALSTHKGVLLKTRLPFGIGSAPGYFQEIMEQLTSDLQGVAVYLDDILVSGANAQEHLANLRALLKRLSEKGLRCRLEKCAFAQPSVEYLGHLLSREGIAKGPKVDATLKMPPPTDPATLGSFMGSINFYNKFLPDLATVTEPLNRLKRKGVPWVWGAEQQEAFDKLKAMLSEDTVLAHFDPKLEIGISCDASNVGIGAVLFHRYQDGSERPIANISKTLTDTQRRYSQIQKEALAIVFALRKFHQFLYGRKFILVTDHKPLESLFGPNKPIPALAANRLARWALLLNQYHYTIEYRKTKDHGNADALSRLPVGPDKDFDGEEDRDDIDVVCMIRTIGQQLKPVDPELICKESAKDPVISKVMRYVREGWPPSKTTAEGDNSYSVNDFRKVSDWLSTTNGCLMYGSRLVIPERLHKQVLDILHLGHFGMQRMKQLARTSVYWPHIDDDIKRQCQQCGSCAEHQNKPEKPPNHPWMLPEKPWSRLHVDHAINFLGSNWLVLVDAYSKYPCIHATTSTSSKATIDILEEDFAHFGYPHTIVSDNATTFMSAEFQAWCKDRGITHLTGAPYHPATNGAAERMVQSFKKAMKKSSKPRKSALQEFLIQYRRTPLESGYSPSELLNGRQIRSKIDTLLPSPAHIAQGKQSKAAAKSQTSEHEKIAAVKAAFPYNVGTPCYALYCGARRDKDPRWIPATVIKVFGTRSVNVKVHPRGPTWRRHVEQLRPRYGVAEDSDPGCSRSDHLFREHSPTGTNPDSSQQPGPSATADTIPATGATSTLPRANGSTRRNPGARVIPDDGYTADNPRRSSRLRHQRSRCHLSDCAN